MKFTARMKVSTVEDRDHCFKFCFVKICSKIIVKPLAKKISLATKSNAIKHSASVESSLSDIDFIQKFRIRK